MFLKQNYVCVEEDIFTLNTYFSTVSSKSNWIYYQLQLDTTNSLPVQVTQLKTYFAES